MTSHQRIRADDHNSPDIIWSSMLILQKVKSEHLLLGHSSKLLFVAPAFEMNKQASLGLLRTPFHCFLIHTPNLINLMEMLPLLNCLQNRGLWAKGQNPKLQVVTQSPAPPATRAVPMGATLRPALKLHGWEGASHCEWPREYNEEGKKWTCGSSGLLKSL